MVFFVRRPMFVLTRGIAVLDLHTRLLTYLETSTAQQLAVPSSFSSVLVMGRGSFTRADFSAEIKDPASRSSLQHQCHTNVAPPQARGSFGRLNQTPHSPAWME